MSDLEKLSKKELQEKAEKIGFFKNKTVKKVYGRTNGSFYYKKPPVIVDGHDTYVISSESKGSTELLKAVEIIKIIRESKNLKELEDYISSDDFSENEDRSTVLNAIDEKRKELETPQS